MAQKIIMNNFILYGLNRYRNFLKSPTSNGEKEYLLLEDMTDVIEFCADILMECKCVNPGMFAVFQNGTYLAAGLTWEEDEPYIIISRKRDMHLFSEFDAELSLHCYGLICEIRPGEWAIQE